MLETFVLTYQLVTSTHTSASKPMQKPELAVGFSRSGGWSLGNTRSNPTDRVFKGRYLKGREGAQKQRWEQDRTPFLIWQIHLAIAYDGLEPVPEAEQYSAKTVFQVRYAQLFKRPQRPSYPLCVLQ